MKEKIQEKLTSLENDFRSISEQLTNLHNTREAISGAIQICKQLLEEETNEGNQKRKIDR